MSAAIFQRPFIIGVAGGSSSGKTTISERLVELTGPEHVSLIELDSYYLDRSDEPPEERRILNYDHPDAFDWPLLNEHLAALAAGASAPVPIYDYALDNRSGRVRIVEPAKIIVVDGILVLWDRDLRERFDLKIFVDTAADVRLIRRLRRDIAERGRTAESIIDQYLATVKPAHERFIEPSKRYADVIIPEGGLNRPAIDAPAKCTTASTPSSRSGAGRFGFHWRSRSLRASRRTRRITRCPPVLRNATNAEPTRPDAPVTATTIEPAPAARASRCAARSSASWRWR